MKVKIQRLIFEPQTYVSVQGIPFPSFNESKICSDTANTFTCSWFWHSTLPENVTDCLKEIISNTSQHLHGLNAITVQDHSVPKIKFPFVFKLKKFDIPDLDQVVSKRISTVELTVESTWFPNNETISRVIVIPTNIIPTNLFKELATLI
jgi:hypothetical protein